MVKQNKQKKKTKMQKAEKILGPDLGISFFDIFN